MIARICGKSTVRNCVIFEHLPYIVNSTRRNHRVNDLLCLCPSTWKFAGCFGIRKYCRPLSCKYYDVSRYEMKTHLLPLKQHYLSCFPMYYRTCYFCRIRFTSERFLVLLAFHVSSKTKSNLVRHSHLSSWFTYQAFGSPLVANISKTRIFAS